MSRRRPVERFDIHECAGVTRQPGHVGYAGTTLSAEIDDDERRRERLFVGFIGDSSEAEHDWTFRNRASQLAVARRQRVEMTRDYRIRRASTFQQALRSEPIGLRHQNIDTDHGGIFALDRAQKLTDHGARTWPMPEPCHAPALDLDARD